MTEVPAYVQTAPTMVNGVHVVGATNWDLSRQAVETPIKWPPSPPQYAGSGHAGNGTGSTVVSDAEVSKKPVIKKKRKVKSGKKLVTKSNCDCKLYDK